MTKVIITILQSLQTCNKSTIVPIYHLIIFTTIQVVQRAYCFPYLIKSVSVYSIFKCILGLALLLYFVFNKKFQSEVSELTSSSSCRNGSLLIKLLYLINSA